MSDISREMTAYRHYTHRGHYLTVTSSTSNPTVSFINHSISIHVARRRR